MPKKNKKIPLSAISQKGGKFVRIPNALNDMKPSWRFSTADKSGDFAWPIGQPEELEIVGKLHSFDSMLWSEIEGPDHHYLSTECISPEAWKRLQAIKKDDEVESLFSFHLAGEPRVICIRDRNVAKLLWFDRKHKVCPSTKR